MNFYHPFIIITVIILSTVYGCEDHDDNSNVLSRVNFQTPSDGKLSEKQIIDYLIIRRKIIQHVNAQEMQNVLLGEVRLGKAMWPADNSSDSTISSDVRDFAEIEKEAANSLSMSYEEFLWIKDKVISTQTKILVQQYYDLNNRIITLLDETLLDYREQNVKSNAHQKSSQMDGYVVEMRQEVHKLHRTTVESGEADETLQHNKKIISKFKKELESIEKKSLEPGAIEQKG